MLVWVEDRVTINSMAGRISIREKLAEKKAAIEHKDKTVQKDQDRKTQREM